MLGVAFSKISDHSVENNLTFLQFRQMWGFEQTKPYNQIKLT